MRLLALGATVVLGFGCAEPTRTHDEPEPLESRRELLRPTDTSSNLMWRYQANDTVVHFDSPDGGFRVHYTRSGLNSVPMLDANDSGVPDFVESVAQVYDEVAALYEGPLAYRRPPSDATLPANGGDGRYDVYLLDFNRAADGALRVDTCTSEICSSYVVQENDFAGYGYPSLREATRILGSHEYFHGVQAAYDQGQNVVLVEGSAVWATEEYDPASNDFESFIPAYFNEPDRSLDSAPGGPVPSFAYASAIFFRFLAERYGRDLIRALWERLENGKGSSTEPNDRANPTFLIQLDALLHEAPYQSSFSEAFRDFAVWNLATGSGARAGFGYAEAARYPRVKSAALTAPGSVSPLRVFYASTQYFTINAAGRTELSAALVDDPNTTLDDLDGMLLALTNGVSQVIVERGALATISVGAGVRLAAINAARAGTGSVLSKRPTLCIGSATEVQTCREQVNPALDAGMPPPSPSPIATIEDPLPPAASGCGCTQTPPLVLLAALLLAQRARSSRRATPSEPELAASPSR